MDLSIFKRQNSQTRTCWGYTFDLTEDHLTPEQSYPLKFSYDKLAQEALEALYAITAPTKTASQESKAEGLEAIEVTAASHPKRDLFFLLKENSSNDPTLRRLWEEVNEVPDWVDVGFSLKNNFFR